MTLNIPLDIHNPPIQIQPQKAEVRLAKRISNRMIICMGVPAVPGSLPYPGLYDIMFLKCAARIFMRAFFKFRIHPNIFYEMSLLLLGCSNTIFSLYLLFLDRIVDKFL